jgi:3-deoxy-D-manno-octulosonic-acid transferase
VSHPIYTAGLAAAVALYTPVALGRRITRGVPLNALARLGYRQGAPSAGRQGWVHAVSVGEAITAAPLLEGLRRLAPDLPLVVTTVTETGARVVRDRFAGLATHRFFPLDLPGAARRVIGAINPAFVIVMETELWPNVLGQLAAAGVPSMIANGRISDRSFRRYRLIREFMRTVLGHVSVLAMQSDEDARRIIALGASPERVHVTGNLKTEAAPDPAGTADLWRRLLGLEAGQRLWIAGSTHHGEEEAVLEAHAQARVTDPQLILVVAPRHPERAPDVERLVRGRGWRVVRRSALATRLDQDAVLVVDTVGELAGLYAVADVVFVGGSLVPAGGHNVLEPALRRKPVLFGPHTENFREATALLVGRGAGLVVHNPAELGDELGRLLADPARRARMGTAGYEAMASRHGAVSRTLELVERVLYPAMATGSNT